MSTICVIGTGYVGLVTGTCFSDMGNQVTCVDIIPEKIERLKQGILPIYEPGLEEMVARNVHAGRLHFTTSYSEGLDNCDFIFIAVNTPTGSSQGGADMRYVESAARGIAQELDHQALIINKSTVPVGSGDVVSRIIRKNLKRPEVHFAVISNPEFLREGSAVQDFQNPDRPLRLPIGFHIDPAAASGGDRQHGILPGRGYGVERKRQLRIETPHRGQHAFRIVPRPHGQPGE